MLWCGCRAGTWIEGHPWRLAASGEAQALGNINARLRALSNFTQRFLHERLPALALALCGWLGGLLHPRCPGKLGTSCCRVAAPFPGFLSRSRPEYALHQACLPAPCSDSLSALPVRSQYHRFTLSAGILSTTNPNNQSLISTNQLPRQSRIFQETQLANQQ